MSTLGKVKGSYRATTLGKRFGVTLNTKSLQLLKGYDKIKFTFRNKHFYENPGQSKEAERGQLELLLSSQGCDISGKNVVEVGTGLADRLDVCK